LVETIYSRVKRQKAAESEVYTASQRTVTPETVDYKPPKTPHAIRADIPEDISRLIANTLLPYQVQRPKFSEIITEINLAKAAAEQRKLVIERRSIVRLPVANDGQVTKTRAIPLMKNLAEEKKSTATTKRKFFR